MSDDGRVQYKFMIPAALKSRIEEAAHSNRRSLSAEVVSALEEKYPEEVYSAERFLALLAELTTAQSLDEMISSEERLNQTLRHLGFNFSAHIVNGSVAFFTDSSLPPKS